MIKHKDDPISIVTRVTFRDIDNHRIRGNTVGSGRPLVLGISKGLCRGLFATAYSETHNVEGREFWGLITRLPMDRTTAENWLVANKEFTPLLGLLRVLRFCMRGPRLFLSPHELHEMKASGWTGDKPWAKGMFVRVITELGIVPGAKVVAPPVSNDALNITRDCMSSPMQAKDILTMARSLDAEWLEYAVVLRIECMLRCNPTLARLVQEREALDTMCSIIKGVYDRERNKKIRSIRNTVL